MATQEPNASELELLKALWRDGRLSARELHDRTGEAQGWSPSTTRTVLRRLVEKGLAARTDYHGLAVYEASAAKVDLISRLVRSFARRVLDADPRALPASTFAGSALLDDAEREELERLLQSADEDTEIQKGKADK
jgi:BlaI family penicillinase repressor